MSVYRTDANELLLIPADQTCAVLFTPPNSEKGEEGGFSDAQQSPPQGKDAILLDEGVARDFLLSSVRTYAPLWGVTAPDESCSDDEMIKWLHTTFFKESIQ